MAEEPDRQQLLTALTTERFGLGEMGGFSEVLFPSPETETTP
jgi:hypothetical protein